MKKSLLFVVHGSRISGKNEELEELLIRVGAASRLPYRVSYLEANPHTIEQMTAELLAEGTSDLLVLPVLILPALHALVDIPEQVEAALAGQAVRVKYLKTFGDEPAILSLLCERLAEARGLDAEADLVLLAHGTRHFAENLDMQLEIRDRLAAETGENIRIATYFKTPDYFYQDLLKSSPKPIVFIPFFLFDGRLVQKIKTIVQGIRPGTLFSKTLELDPQIEQALLGIIEEEKTFDSAFNRLT